MTDLHNCKLCESEPRECRVVPNYYFCSNVGCIFNTGKAWTPKEWEKVHAPDPKLESLKEDRDSWRRVAERLQQEINTLQSCPKG